MGLWAELMSNCQLFSQGPGRAKLSGFAAKISWTTTLTSKELWPNGDPPCLLLLSSFYQAPLPSLPFGFTGLFQCVLHLAWGLCAFKDISYL